MKLVGLSLSFCIMDILSGKVDLEDVDHIEAGTAMRNPEDMAKVLNTYTVIYWRNDPRGAEIARQLFAENRVSQPRLQGCEAHNLALGWWTVTHSE